MRYKIRDLEVQMKQLEKTLEKADRAIGEIDSMREQLHDLQERHRKERRKNSFLITSLIVSNLLWVLVLVLCICAYK